MNRFITLFISLSLIYGTLGAKAVGHETESSEGTVKAGPVMVPHVSIDSVGPAAEMLKFVIEYANSTDYLKEYLYNEKSFWNTLVYTESDSLMGFSGKRVTISIDGRYIVSDFTRVGVWEPPYSKDFVGYGTFKGLTVIIRRDEFFKFTSPLNDGKSIPIEASGGPINEMSTYDPPPFWEFVIRDNGWQLIHYSDNPPIP